MVISRPHEHGSWPACRVIAGAGAATQVTGHSLDSAAIEKEARTLRARMHVCGGVTGT